MHWRLNKSQTILLMIPLVSAYSFSLDLYIPLLPTIQAALKVSRFDMQLTNSLFMLFCCVGQLIFGPLSDKTGRRNILFISLLISITANFICFSTTQYYIFLLGKSLQAIGACGTYLSCYATVRDLYHNPEKSAEMFSYLNIANSVSAIIAPSIGTQIGKKLGWTYIFIALSVYAAYGCITCYCYYAETAPSFVKPKQKRQGHVLTDYWRIFTDINYQVYTLPAALGVSSFFAYYSISPYLYQQTFGLTKEIYSILYGSCGLTFFISSFICSKLVRRVGIIKTLWIGITCHAVGCIGTIASFILLNKLQLAGLHFSIMVMIWGSALMVSAGIGGTMAPFESIAGSAFALISAYKFGMCYVLGELAMTIYNNTPIPMGLMLLSINMIASIILFLFRHKLMGTKVVNKSASAASEMATKSTDNFF